LFISNNFYLSPFITPTALYVVPKSIPIATILNLYSNIKVKFLSKYNIYFNYSNNIFKKK